jgi:SAM-dependent methyltransferase
MLTYRRHLLDELLSSHEQMLHGICLDLGGEKIGSRGDFKRNPTLVDQWIYLNIDGKVGPDTIADAHGLPFPGNLFDCVVCCEVLEHLHDPFLCTSEILRVLKPEGVLLLSTPFMFPIHADPFDYYRFTPQGLVKMLADYSYLEIIPMGSTWGTIGLLIDLAARELNHKTFRKGTRTLGRFMASFEKRQKREGEYSRFSTGYFCIAQK